MKRVIFVNRMREKITVRAAEGEMIRICTNVYADVAGDYTLLTYAYVDGKPVPELNRMAGQNLNRGERRVFCVELPAKPNMVIRWEVDRVRQPKFLPETLAEGIVIVKTGKAPFVPPVTPGHAPIERMPTTYPEPWEREGKEPRLFREIEYNLEHIIPNMSSIEQELSKQGTLVGIGLIASLIGLLFLL